TEVAHLHQLLPRLPQKCGARSADPGGGLPRRCGDARGAGPAGQADRGTPRRARGATPRTLEDEARAHYRGAPAAALPPRQCALDARSDREPRGPDRRARVERSGRPRQQGEPRMKDARNAAMKRSAEEASAPLVLPSDQDATGRTLGAEEIERVAEAIRSGTLTSTKGEFTKRFQERFAALHGGRHAWACASGSAAVHIAVAAIDPEPGDEIVTTAITDMGALAPILYQGAIPVFADVDPRTCNVTAETIRARLSPRTRAIVVTHLFGNPCEMGDILALARERGLPVIEDCAQAFLARSGGRLVGALGAIGAFSLQQGKHITTGEGGIVLTDDAELSRRSFLFINKAWGYGDPKPDHYFLALNYRTSELQGAVAL